MANIFNVARHILQKQGNMKHENNKGCYIEMSQGNAFSQKTYRERRPLTYVTSNRRGSAWNTVSVWRSLPLKLGQTGEYAPALMTDFEI